MRAMLAAAALAFAVAFIVVRILITNFGRLALDRPNERSLHERPVPRIGGIGILCGAAVAIGFGALEVWLPVTLAALLAVLSFTDDVYGVPTVLRFALHIAAAGILVWAVAMPMHPVALVLLALAVAWITNLYNFMDGSDGLAGGMTVIGFGAYAFLADDALGMLSTTISAGAAAFLILNFHPARIFMGDVGSIPIGFLAGSLGIVGWRDGSWPLWFPLLVFAPFICDATLTLGKRLLRGERLWHAHRDHYYQRLVRMGFGHRGTAYVEYVIMVSCAAAAIFAQSRSPAVQVAVIAGAIVVLIAIAIWVDIRWARYLRSSERVA